MRFLWVVPMFALGLFLAFSCGVMATLYWLGHGHEEDE